MFSRATYVSQISVGKRLIGLALILAIGVFAANSVQVFAQDTLLVEIDIKPGSDPNSINPGSKGTIPVAILSTADFDAQAISCETLTFGHTGDEKSLAWRGKPGDEVPQCSLEDVNGDGLLDLVCHFMTQLTGFQVGDVEGILRGMTADGNYFEGRDTVQIVP